MATDSNSLHQHRFIVVEGAIAAGKTTLAEHLHKSLGGELELQPYEENPYLEAFYAANNQQKKAEELGLLKDTDFLRKAEELGLLKDTDFVRRAKELHLLKDTAFLFQGVVDLRRIADHLKQGKTVVTDWLFEKFEIWQWDTPNQAKYRETLHLWSQELPKPDLVLYLRASVETLLQRIRSRNRPMEASIPPAYLHMLTEQHEQFFSCYPEERLICVSEEEQYRQEQYRQLLGDIKDRLGLL